VCLPDCRIAPTCAEGALCNPANGRCEDPREQCEDLLIEGDACDPAADCCDLGFTCVGEGEDVDGGTCRRACDASQQPDGCNLRELCVPFEEVVDPTAPAPGFCFPGQDCTPGDEVEACGEGEWTCLALEPITLCQPAGEAALGEACDPFQGPNCGAGLVCQYGECKRPCDADGLCPGGETCLDISARVDGVPFAFCHQECDVFSQQGCGAGEACVVIDADGPFVLGGCVDAPSGDGTQGEGCEPDEATYWGSCTAGHLCDVLRPDEPPVCLGFCDAVDRSLCEGGASCVPGLFGGVFADVGLCLGDCTVLGDDPGCPAGQYCDFSGRIGLGADDEDVAVGFCTPGAQRRDTGDPCTIDEATGASDCANGNICVALEEDGPTTCVRLCEDLPRSPHGCPAGSFCATGFFGGDDTGEGASVVIGACLPE
jgi:hypothetical protein